MVYRMVTIWISCCSFDADGICIETLQVGCLIWYFAYEEVIYRVIMMLVDEMKLGYLSLASL
jgi:hypothetical protein